MEYNKQTLDTPDLIALLKQRGLVITNEQEALKTLSVISYFRLACYFRPMEADKQTHKFREGSTLEQVMALYEFDTALRDMVFCAIRQIEVALRTRINHHFSRNHTPFWFSQVDFKALLTKYPTVDTAAMGFPRGWQQEPLWH